MRRIEPCALVWILLTVPWAVWRVDLGPTLWILEPRHGVHESDAVVLALSFPIWLILLARLWRTR